MEDENKQEQQNNVGSEPESLASRPHVRVFGAEVNTGDGDWSQRRNESKEEWRKRKDEWKQKHRQHIEQNKEQWKAQRHEWRDEHRYGGSLFGGLVILLLGVLALLYTMGFVSHDFWHAILPFWPILFILWGASMILGRHWFSRFILFLVALAILILVVFYGLVKTDSPLVSSLSPNVVRAIQISQPK
jgi:uncharacterized membrane protein